MKKGNKTIEDILKIELQPSAAAKGIFPNFSKGKKN